MKIRLVKNGIFPIVIDKDAHDVPMPDTGLLFPGCVQGEGKLTGTSCLFIRFSGCNLRCMWKMSDGKISICDTTYSSHNAKYFDEWEIDDIVCTIGMNINYMKYIVITGGEPTIQPGLIQLVKELKNNYPDVHITLETNGTNFVKKAAKYIDLFSISPKLQDSVPTVDKIKKLKRTALKVSDGWTTIHDNKRINIEVLDAYNSMCKPNIFGKKKHDIQLKFVVTKLEDEIQIKNILEKIGNIRREDIYIMPVGNNKKQLDISTSVAIEMAIKNGWQFSQRLHINLFGSKKGV